jgi:hypothetical protein
MHKHKKIIDFIEWEMCGEIGKIRRGEVCGVLLQVPYLDHIDFAMASELKVTFSDKNNKFQYDGHAVRIKVKSMKKKGGKLYLGDRDSCSMVQLKFRNVTHVVCSDTDLHGRCKEADITYCKIDPIDDKRICFTDAYKFIDNALESGSNTLITCETGLGKSACILLYYMMKREQTTLADSHRYINSLRPGINSDDKKSGFRPNCVEILIDEEKKMYKNSKVSHGKIPSCELRSDRSMVYIDGKENPYSTTTNSLFGGGGSSGSSNKNKKPKSDFQVFRALLFLIFLFAFMFFFIGAARKFFGLHDY